MTLKHVFGILGLCLISVPLFAQDKEIKKTQAKQAEARKADPEKPEAKVADSKKVEPKKAEPIKKALRDPTAANGVFQPYRGGVKNRQQVRATQLPEIQLKGRVLVEGKDPAALIEIEKRVIVVRVGTELTLNTKSSVLSKTAQLTGRKGQAVLTGLVLKVTKLTASDIQFEVLSTKQTLIVR
ncbi:MAG: hypothetical protein P1V97_32940 [Planctomycetota bacterium]|nr:hypothetical protein [Planctomycetota bacterium]